MGNIEHIKGFKSQKVTGGSSFEVVTIFGTPVGPRLWKTGSHSDCYLRANNGLTEEAAIARACLLNRHLETWAIPNWVKFLKQRQASSLK
jgi:hypothetical protein